jgi:carboxylate-amine ligase
MIPETVFSQKGYHQEILLPIKKAIFPYDPTGILDYRLLNARGAIARFERKSIEIRLIDVQECVKADIAILQIMVHLLKKWVNEDNISYDKQKEFITDKLAIILEGTIKQGENYLIEDETYLSIFDIKQPCRAGELWQKIIQESSLDFQNKEILNYIVQQGTLSTRLQKQIRNQPSTIQEIYQKLSACLANNELL